MASLGAAFSAGIKNLTEMPVGRQLAIFGLTAGGLAVAIAILIWAMTPNYGPLFAQIGETEAAEVVKALAQMGVPYRVDSQNGRIEVPERRIAETRLLLAGQGLPKAADLGFELLQEKTGFGASRLLETARHQRALEGELARSIAALEPVETARVHLARPERSVFVRERAPTTASVVVHLRGTRDLSPAQVAAIVHLVSSSVPDLNPDNVTVVDQRGQLLTQKENDKNTGANADQLYYTRQIEEAYATRVRTLLHPLFGIDKVRVQVAADLDFSRIERTEESYDPQRGALRSEQLNEEERTGSDAAAGGVPGALTNQPPEGGTLGGAGGGTVVPKSRSLRSTRNYEVDRAIAHIRETPGGIRRLSTAVVIDYITQTNEAGETVRAPLPEAELENIRALVREAVGFDAQRGDSLNVTSAAFVKDVPSEEEIPLWQQPWFMDLAKLVAGVILVLLIMLTVIRPVLRQALGITDERKDLVPAEGELPEGEADAASAEEGGDTVSLSPQASALAALTGPKEIDQQELDLNAVRELVKQDPRRVAQVMKAWLAADGEEE